MSDSSYSIQVFDPTGVPILFRGIKTEGLKFEPYLQFLDKGKVRMFDPQTRWFLKEE